MPRSCLWRRLLKTQAMRQQHAVCPACSLPLAFRTALLIRRNFKDGFVPENIQLVHPECQVLSWRTYFVPQATDIHGIAAE